jgi:hypothetical protein
MLRLALVAGYFGIWIRADMMFRAIGVETGNGTHDLRGKLV